MSIIFEVKDDNSNLPDIIAQYDDMLKDYRDDLEIEGKTLQKANLEQASMLAYYDERRIELYTLQKHYENKLNEVKGKLWVGYTENFSISLAATDKTQYIMREERYLEYCQYILIVSELHKKFESIVEAFKSRGFALRNITNARVAAIEDQIL